LVEGIGAQKQTAQRKQGLKKVRNGGREKDKTEAWRRRGKHSYVGEKGKDDGRKPSAHAHRKRIRSCG